MYALKYIQKQPIDTYLDESETLYTYMIIDKKNMSILPKNLNIGTNFS